MENLQVQEKRKYKKTGKYSKKLKKTKEIKPFMRSTTRQKALIEKLTENSMKGKIEPIGKTMFELGYTKNTSNQPIKIIQGRGFQALMEKAGITDELLNNVLKDGLQAEKCVYSFGKIVNIEKDHYARHRFLDTALKVKGVLRPQQNDDPAQLGDPAGHIREISLMVKETFKEK